ncbi:MAG: hypothetical protein ABIH26_15700 [Candidatus Eisenbacteria bacterium]
MSLVQRSKREHCPRCGHVNMQNLLLVQPGEDVQVFVECATCGEFVARYTLRLYTSHDPYRSFLRMMRQRRLSSGAAALKQSGDFTKALWEEYRTAKERVRVNEETRKLEDLLDEMDGPI